MTVLEAETLSVPTSTTLDISRSTSPVANRQPSRSPHPYRRRQEPKRPALQHHSYPPTPALLSSPESSKPGTPQKSSYSESGTEADDELTRRLPAPPALRRISSEDEVWNRDGSGLRGRGRQRNGAPSKAERPKKRAGIAFIRRAIEVALSLVLVVVALLGQENRAWREMLLRKKEVICWLIPYLGLVAAYPFRVLLRDGTVQLPRSLDPSPLLYPSLFPVLIALSLTPVGAGISNPFLLVNLVLSISNLPPILASSWNLQWLLSLLPLLPSQWDQGQIPINDTLSLITPINITLTSALTSILHPSLTSSELRLLSSALINLLFHASSPQAVILRALVWGGGVAVFLLCEDVISWNVMLARVPIHRFRRAGYAIIGASRLRRLAGLEKGIWSTYTQASDSEAEITTPIRRQAKPRKGSYFATLTKEQARVRRLGYTACVYSIVLGSVFFALRPYIRDHALDGMDPFVWAPGYVFCGQSWYQRLVDRFSPGSGYCVTAGSTAAANLRLGIVGFWAVILTIGLTVVTTFAHKLEVDTRRKIFHGMVVPMFLIPGLLDPPFTHLCLSIAVALFLLVDLIRAGQLPPASQYIARFLQPYVDGRDLKGPMVISHVFLLVGAGMGWWLTLASRCQSGWDWEEPASLTFSTGVACVGLGDAAASLIGRRFGRHKWGWKGGKSVEGSLAFTVAVVSGLVVARLWIVGTDMGDWGVMVWAKLLFAGAWGSMLEATATGVNDNVVVPVGVWVIVRGLGL